MANLKLDIGIYNIGIKVSKCILVNLLESLSQQLLLDQTTMWMIFHTSSASPSPVLYLKF
jgi:hypothetical protein